METKGGRQSRPKQQIVLLGCIFFVKSVGDCQPDKGGIPFHHALAEVIDNM